MQCKSGDVLEERAKELAALLKLMSNENRLLILCTLLDGPHTVGEVGERVSSISQPAISQHLQLLKMAGVLSSKKFAQSVSYEIADKRIIAVMDVLREQYCMS